ncbi:MAG: hypothetical protein AAGA54_29550 [Myxococcota bacterium]
MRLRTMVLTFGFLAGLTACDSGSSGDESGTDGGSSTGTAASASATTTGSASASASASESESESESASASTTTTTGESAGSSSGGGGSTSTGAADGSTSTGGGGSTSTGGSSVEPYGPCPNGDECDDCNPGPGGVNWCGPGCMPDGDACPAAPEGASVSESCVGFGGGAINICALACDLKNDMCPEGMSCSPSGPPGSPGVCVWPAG